MTGISRRDVILDFLAFGFIGGEAFSGKAGELHAIKSGASTIIEGDTDGNGRADFQIALKDMRATLQAGDFIL